MIPKTGLKLQHTIIKVLIQFNPQNQGSTILKITRIKYQKKNQEMQNLTKAQIFSRESYRSQRQQSKIRSYRRATSKRRPIPRCSLVVYRRSTAATDPLYSTLYSALVLAATAAAAARPLLLSAGAAAATLEPRQDATSRCKLVPSVQRAQRKFLTWGEQKIYLLWQHQKRSYKLAKSNS